MKKIINGITVLSVFLAALGILFFAEQTIPARAAEMETQVPEIETQAKEAETAAEEELQSADGQALVIEEDAGGTRAEAMEIELNQTYSEVLSSGSDEDYFKFTTTERGYVQVTLEHNAADENSVGYGWNVYIQDGEGNTILSRGDIKTSWTSAALPYATGTSFYVRVISANGVYGAVDCLYDLTVTQTVEDNWELEENDTKAVATVIETDRTYHGNLLYGSDNDFFQFTTTEQGYFQVQLIQNEADPNSTDQGWLVRVLDDAGNVMVAKDDITKNWTSVRLPYAEKGKTFYVQVLSSNGVYGAIYNTYDLTVTQTAAPDWESEQNGTLSTADIIQLGETYHGMLLNGDDFDYFKFTTEGSGYFQVRFAHNEADIYSVDQGWNVKVLNDAGEVMTESGKITKNWMSVRLPYARAGETFYVQVLSYNGVYGATYCTYDLTATYTAASDWESEPNGTMPNANLIQLGKTYHGMLLYGSDNDYYRFTTTAPGYFQVRFAHNDADTYSVDQGWSVRVLDSLGAVITESGKITKHWTSIGLPYAGAGKTFYVQVLSYNGVYGATYCTYDLTVTQTAATDWESEPNGTMAAATPIGVNQTYHGITGSSGDKDLFRFTTTARGYFNVQLSHNHTYSSNENPNWEVSVLDSAGEQIIRYNDVRTAITSVALPYAQAGRTFYIQVERYSGSAWGAYDLSVVQTAATDWELEPNGTLAGATPIQIGKTYQGITLSSSEKDYYKTNVSSTGRLKIRLSPLASNAPGSVRNGWDIFVYDKKYKEVARLSGVKTDDSFGLDVKKGTYYIRIEPYNSWSAPTFCRYSVTTTFAKSPSKPKMASVKAAKRAAIVKWKKVSGASGYYIYRSETKTGEYVKVKTIKKGSTVSWKNKKLYSGKRYYYKVVAYKKTKGMVAVSSYSKVKSVKVK